MKAMLRNRIILVACGLASISLQAACLSASKIRADAQIVRVDIDKAKHQEAVRCAPKELALAETNHQFCLDELAQGNQHEAQKHIEIALQAIHQALEKSKDCKPTPAPKTDTDTDSDGILDALDRCPQEPEDIDQFQDTDGCPDPDNDQDGILDAADKCPNDPEDIDQVEDQDGCPDIDTDQDTILDADDKCPTEPEDIDEFQDEDGCPDPDNDGDTIPDPEDACPNEPGPPDSPQGKGCPRKYSLVKIDREKQRIEIKQTIHFASGKWRILPKSFGLLNQVAQVLTDYPKMRVSIEGHTDSLGADNLNQRLSENRAEAVKTYLMQRGITNDRLETAGYGEAMPIASNRTARGRATNRRVEFRIISEQSEENK